jgi:selenocysteine lyase/cysteine desulfurase
MIDDARKEPLRCQRDAFSIPPDVTYLNAAYMGPLSNAVVEAGMLALQRRACPVGIVPQDFFVHAERARVGFGALVNADSDSIAIISTAAYGIATVAKNIKPQRGQNIVVLAEQFPSNVYVWRRWAERGVTIRTVSKPADGQSWSDAVIAAIDAMTIVVAIETAYWTDGSLLDVPRIAKAAQGAGAWTIVDATQTVGAQPFDFAASGVDALIVHSYKSMLCNYGLGFAAYSQRMRDAEPLEEGWLMRKGSEDFTRLVDYQDTYADGMRRFDTSTRANPSLILMLDRAVEQLLAWEPVRIRAYTLSISRTFVSAALKAGYTIADEADRAGNIFGVRPPAGTDLNALRERLAAARVYVSVRGSAIRIAPHVYNAQADFDRLAEVLALGA